jgi:hypothetical protein
MADSSGQEKYEPTYGLINTTQLLPLRALNPVKKSHQIIAGMITVSASRPAAAVAARPAFVR